MSLQAKMIEPISTFFDVISGCQSKKRDWEKMRSIFYPGAVLFPNSITHKPTFSPGVDIDTYIDNLEKYLSQNDFFEQCSITQIVTEGNIASVISTYEARRSVEDKLPLKKGINYIHLICTGDEWKITSMIWQDN